MHVIVSISVMPDEQSLGGGGTGQAQALPSCSLPTSWCSHVSGSSPSAHEQMVAMLLSHPEQTLFHSFVSEPERITNLN